MDTTDAARCIPMEQRGMSDQHPHTYECYGCHNLLPYPRIHHECTHPRQLYLYWEPRPVFLRAFHACFCWLQQRGVPLRVEQITIPADASQRIILLIAEYKRER